MSDRHAPVVRLTGRGAAVLAGAAVLLLLGWLAGYPVLVGLAASAVGAVLAALLTTGRRLRVSVDREVYPDRVRRGRPAFARLRVHNPGQHRQSGFTAGDRVGTGFTTVTVRPLPPGSEAVYHYDLPTGQRGRHAVGPLTLDRVDPLGLGRCRISTGTEATLWVHPRIHPLRAIAGGHPRHHHEGRTADTLRGSSDLREVREYVAGDEVRHMHWKASAHTGQLMVGVYTDPDQPRFTALLDTRAFPPEAFEDAVDLAASLIVASAGAEHRCRLVTSGGLDVAATGGGPALRRVLDELSLLSPGSPGPLVPGELSRSAGGSLAVIVAALSDADRTALAALRRHLTTMIVIAVGASVGAIPGATLLSATDAADAARQWNTVIAA